MNWAGEGEREFDEGYLVLAFTWIAEKLKPRERVDEWIVSNVVSLASLILVRLQSRVEPAGMVHAPRGLPLELRRRSPFELLRRLGRRLLRWWRALFGKPERQKRPARMRHHERPIPHDSDRTILGWLARVVVNESRPDRRRTLWHPWMRLSLDYEHFVETFLDDIYGAGLDNEAPFFAELLLEIGSFLRTDSWLTRASGEAGMRVAVCLIGRGPFARISDRWDATRAPIAVRCRDLWREWLAVAYDWHGCLAAFCDVLRAPAFSAVRVEGMTWIVGYDLERALRDAEAQDAVTRLLELVIAEHQEDLDRTPSSLAAFERLLEALVARRNKRAIVLSARLGTGKGAFLTG